MALLFRARPSHIHQYSLIALLALIASSILFFFIPNYALIINRQAFPLWAFPLMAGLLALLYVWFFSRNTVYVLNDKDLISNCTGFLSNRCSIIPIQTIDNIHTRRDFIDSLFGLVDIHVDTPEHYGDEMVMRHIPQKKAEKMLEILSDLTDKTTKTTGPAPKKTG